MEKRRDSLENRCGSVDLYLSNQKQSNCFQTTLQPNLSLSPVSSELQTIPIEMISLFIKPFALHLILKPVAISGEPSIGKPVLM